MLIKDNLEGKDYWLRWQSKAVNTQGELKDQYKLAKIWSDSVSNANLQDATKIIAIDSWSLLYFRGNTWSNALSSSDAEDLDDSDFAIIEDDSGVITTDRFFEIVRNKSI